MTGIFTAIGNKLRPHGYLSDEQAARQVTYRNYEAAYRNRPDEVTEFQKDCCSTEARSDEYYNYTPVSWGKLIVDTFSNLLFSSRPAVTAKEQDYVSDLIFRTDLWAQMHKAAKSSALKGDGIIKVSWDGRQPCIQAVDPANWRPVTDPANPAKETGGIYHFFHEEQWLIEEIYEPGRISYKVFEYDVKRDRLGMELDPQSFAKEHPELALTPVEFDEPIQLLFHVPNELLDNDCLGISALEPVMPLISEYNRRLSEIARICTGTAYPLTTLPKNQKLKKATDGAARLNRRYENVLVVDSKEQADSVRVIENTSNLEQLYKELDRLETVIILTSKLSPAVLGLERGGGGDISGKSRYMSLLPTLKELENKGHTFTRAIQSVLYSAMYLDRALGEKDITPEIVTLQFSDDIVADRSQDIIDVKTEIEAGVVSLATARKKLGYDPDVEAKLKAEETPAPQTPPKI